MSSTWSRSTPGYAASAIERDRLLDQVTARNRVLETIREMLETLAGPVPVGRRAGARPQSLLRGLQADEVDARDRGRPTACCGAAAAAADRPAQPRGRAAAALLAVADGALGGAAARHGADRATTTGRRPTFVAVTFAAPGRRRPCWRPAGRSARRPPTATALLEDAAHSLRLALEREEALVRPPGGNGTAPLTGAAARLPVPAEP